MRRFLRNLLSHDQYFTHPGVVYFAAAGDSGLGVSGYPAASPNVVSVGGTYFNRDSNGNFTYDQYYTGGGEETSVHTSRVPAIKKWHCQHRRNPARLS